MANLFAKHETDPTAERAGIRVEIDGATFIVRRAGGANRAYRYALAVATIRQRDAGTTPDDPAAAFNAHDDAVMQAFVDAVLIGWENVDGRDGQPLPFTPANALDLLRTCSPVWDELRAAAIDSNRFKVQVDEDIAVLGES